MAKLTVKLVADILQTALGLPAERIAIYNQRRPLPTDPGLYLTVAIMGAPVTLASNNKFKATGDGAHEERSQLLQETIQIDATSQDTSALVAYPEIIGALNSIYSQQVQEREGFKIATIPTTVNDVSGIDGASIPYRVSVTVRVLRAYSTENAVQYYEKFSNETYTEKGKVE